MNEQGLLKLIKELLEVIDRISDNNELMEAEIAVVVAKSLIKKRGL